ncbi:hypothetical protein BTI_1004 [Burkholderia thailandensis MSMB121]|uniref:Polar amino acid uptake ABC transporter, PAAT family, ATP-binding protein n=1 Tax=Burkholderia humptydooensis MSMB43 TaxID=441157 RepID=A0ABN0G855_9BURK|nr:hypothetical protein BTI_1004 [Burkholderia thailandensis MSMB121]AJY43746.1 ABC transporter family protein [Burkholderia sp. 2002721687]ALX41831.1 amino acid ABC transporter ATP-binding protein [Burkholderia humptydooensis]EIP88488.1 polar amino acid uptake ABC transporter, PAAT family, ATP-binding protein [Burkholderia humptydooensis MSMB43]KVN05637.1 amino acid ABC transporter ATP-binding protein [Burkholderia sp. MSMB1552]KWZ56650.1 amino acid ABC transporter ATP-binding protein [Burkho
MITLDNVSKWYGSHQVLADCSAAVSKGEVVVVCGPSGSGKSTLIKTIRSTASSRSRKAASPSTARGSAIRRSSSRGCARGRIEGNGPVLFVHTGGAPALFAYQDACRANR